MGNSIIKPAVTQKSSLTLEFEGFLLYEIPFVTPHQKHKNIEFWQIQAAYNQAKESMRNLHFRKFMLFRDFALNKKIKIPEDIIKIVVTGLCSKLLDNEREAEIQLKMLEFSYMYSK